MGRRRDQTALLEARRAVEASWSEVGGAFTTDRPGLARAVRLAGAARWNRWAPILLFAAAAGFVLGSRWRRSQERSRRG